MKTNRPMGGRGFLFVGLSLLLLCFFLTPCNAVANGGKSWKRNITNKSSQTIVLTADLRHGNAWFNDSNENGPFTMSPHSQATVTYTTTGGMSDGTVTVKAQDGALICIRSWNGAMDGYYSSQYSRCPESGNELVITD